MPQWNLMEKKATDIVYPHPSRDRLNRVHNNMVDIVLAFKNLENYRKHLKTYRKIKYTNI